MKQDHYHMLELLYRLLRRKLLPCYLVAWLAVGLLAACANQPSGGASSAGEMQTAGAALNTAVNLGEGEKLKVVVTTNILGDVVRQVSGDDVELQVLMDIGTDPHTYLPAPADSAALHDAHLLIINGAGLEENLIKLIISAGALEKTLEASAGIRLLSFEEHEDELEDESEQHGEFDPHVWFDVQNVKVWVENIERTLSTLDPAHADRYAANARAYLTQLDALDGWITEQVAEIPAQNRKLVSSHPVYGYFAARYGFEQAGVIYPITPSAEPSARELAALEDLIAEYDIPALFTESTVNTRLAQQIAADTGVQIIMLYTGSLGPTGSGAENYIAMMQYDVRAIVDALR